MRLKIQGASQAMVTKRHRFVTTRVRPVIEHKHLRRASHSVNKGLLHLEKVGIERTAAFVAVGVTVLALGLGLTAQTRHSFRVFADEKRVVQLSIDGQRRMVVSSASTVKDILTENGINLKSGDVVEPEADTVVDQPNYNINIYKASPAVVVDQGKFIQVVTGYRSARKIASAAGITLYPEDKANLEQVNDFESTRTLGYKVTVDRAVPVQLIVNGQVVNMRTHQKTVGDLLKEKNVDYKPTDLQGVKPDTAIVAGERIVVSATSQETVVATEDVAPGTQTVIDANLSAGQTQTRRAGVAGRKQVTYLVEKTAGQETKRTVLEEQVLTPAIDAIVARGTRAVSSGATPEKWAKLRFCESGGNYANKRNPLYRGAYQFDYSTWKNFGGYYDPADAPPEVQDAAAFALYARRGPAPWPVCGRFLY